MNINLRSSIVIRKKTVFRQILCQFKMEIKTINRKVDFHFRGLKNKICLKTKNMYNNAYFR